jgi:hypothetical protein
MLANVDVYLQAYRCDPTPGCRFVTVATRSSDVREGRGRGKRATALFNCRNNNVVGWRGFVDVDLIGVNDPAGFTYSLPQNLTCSP